MACLLTDQGIENYCPVNKVIRQWSDRKKTILEPVFRGYVFVSISENKKWEVRKINGVLNYVFWLGKPAIIREEEISLVKKFLNEFEEVSVENRKVAPGGTVRISQGIFMNYKGMVLEVWGNRAIVKIDTLDIQLSAHFDKKHLELVSAG